MPVTTRIITADSGSSRNVKFTLKSPAVIQSNTGCTMARDSGSRPTRRHTDASATTNDAIIAPHATAPDALLVMRRPTLALTRNPTNGRSGISSSTPSPLQRREGIGIERLAVAEQADHNREADLRFCCGDGHDEEHDDLTVRAAERSPERDERQVDRVQHDLDRQEDRDQVAAHEHPRRANGEQDGRQHQVVVERRHQRCPSRRASTTAPTIATMIRTEVTSNANAYCVKSDRPIAATLVTDPPANRPDSAPFVSAHRSSTINTIASSAPNRIGPGRISGWTRSS